MSERKMIERALVSYLEEGYMQRTLEEGFSYGQVLDALAEQAIVIEDAHIEHRDISAPITVVTCKGRTLKTKAGHHGTPGKALAIIVPLEEER